MGYRETLPFMHTMGNNQIRVTGIFSISLYWEHSKSSLLAILKYSVVNHS